MAWDCSARLEVEMNDSDQKGGLVDPSTTKTANSTSDRAGWKLAASTVTVFVVGFVSILTWTQTHALKHPQEQAAVDTEREQFNRWAEKQLSWNGPN
jgi:hypothetical protein